MYLQKRWASYVRMNGRYPIANVTLSGPLPRIGVLKMEFVNGWLDLRGRDIPGRSSFPN
mgnify:FL=1|jgi:hypothetical protein